MKTLKQIDQLLSDFEKRYSLNVRGCEQGSAAWFNMKLGVISASNASRAVAKTLPFAIRSLAINSSVAGCRSIRPAATASRWLSGFAETSTIFALPSLAIWVKLSIR